MRPALFLSCGVLVAAVPYVILSGCGGDGPGGVTSFGGGFLVLSTEPQNNARIFLNDPIAIDFTERVDLETVDFNTFRFEVLDASGAPLAESPTGTFRLGTSPGDAEPGRRLLFEPRLPDGPNLAGAGFLPARRYVVSLVGATRRSGTVLRSEGGQALAVPVSFQFTTVEGSTPPQLFRNRRPGGPRRSGFTVTPLPAGGEAPLGLFGHGGIELRLSFDQPLLPDPDNLPAVPPDPTLRDPSQRGRIHLTYDDPESGRDTWIPAAVELEQNHLSGSVVVVRPLGVLPNNAEVRVIVEATLEDLTGESNAGDPFYERVFASFRTESDYGFRFDAVIDEFDAATFADETAPFLEPVAELSGGALQAAVPFEGASTVRDYEPRSREVVLNTNFTQVVPTNGPAFNVSGGVFRFRDVTIPRGVRVSGTGSNPMVWQVTGDFVVAGELTVRGGDGARVNTLASANFPTAGGVGVCGGGNGGRGSPDATARSLVGESGFGAGQRPGEGGRGGELDCTRCGGGSGGGGGSFSTQGDPYHPVQGGPGTLFQQVRGIGGQGCSGAGGSATRVLPGGAAGPVAFTDSRDDNDFWGRGVDVNRQLRITGELTDPRGGAGGGGGGDMSPDCDPTSMAFIGDAKGGGGGGGGGVLIVQALGRIVVEQTGAIVADGGHGGGGQPAGASTDGGGGGGGSGGMIVLMAAGGIDIHVKGDAASNRWTFAEGDFSFAISADGGVSTTGTFGTPVISGKYGQLTAAQWDGVPTGGFGGLGLVQLMAPPGDNDDGTNTVLDDGIRVFRQGNELSGAEKQRMLAWRGFPDDNGVPVDDFGNPTDIGADIGDIRPTPILLPVTFGSKSRMRSRWIASGATVRRPLTAPDGLPRGVVEEPGRGLLAGPAWRFAGTDAQGGTAGYASFEAAGNSALLVPPAVLGSPAAVAEVDAEARFLGRPAYRVELAASALGAVPDRYAQYDAELLGSGRELLGSFRILTHDSRSLLLSPETGSLPSGVSELQVRARFFRVETGGAEGLGPSYPGVSGPVPQSNVRVGFAFHRDPANALSRGNDPNRLPPEVGEYLFDLSDPMRQEQVRVFGATAVQYDVLFDLQFESRPGDTPPPLRPGSPRPRLDWLRLPIRF